MTALPFEIVEEILRRLPVKTLKQFRVVAKSWCYLIDSYKFAKMHLNHSLMSNSCRNLILGGLGLYTIDLDSLNKAQVVKPPFYYKSVDGISNSYNGIVLVMSEPPVLWNPFSSDYKILPMPTGESSTEDVSYSKTTYGFGYDSRNDDYKVIRVVEFRNKLTHVWLRSEVRIYGLKSKSWRKIPEFPYPLPFLKGHWRVHVNGALHTLVELDPLDRAKIMSFNVETEKHDEVMMPPGIRIRNFDLNLDMIGDRLCLVCSQRSRVVIWVMKEYGMKESWTKLLSVGSPAIERDDFVKPLVYSKDGSKVLLNCDDKRLIWYDLKNKTVEEVFVDGMPFVFYAEACVESLVKLDGPESDTAKTKDQKKAKPNLDKRKLVMRNRKNRDDFLSEGFKLVL